MPMPEIGGDAPRYFAPSDPEDLAQAMNDVLGNPDHAMELATAAATRSKLFDVSVSARDTWKRILALAS
jgi:glycosyltransferase involved in cell wall biosynthesis